MSFVHDWCGPRRRFARRYARDGDTKSRAPAQPGFEGQAAAQLLGYEIEDDVKAKAGAALVPARGEERVERAALDILAHAHPVVGYEDIHVLADLAGLDDDASGPALGKSVDHAVEKQVGQDLTVGARIAVHGDAGRHINGEGNIAISSAQGASWATI